MSEAALGDFYRGTHPGALSAGRTLAKLADLSDVRHLVDVGGGSGGVSIGLCENYPDLRATIAEFDAVVPVTRSIIAEEGMADRIEVIAANVVASELQGEYDAAILRNLIQVLSAEDAAVLRRDCIRTCGVECRDPARRQASNRVKPFLLFRWAAKLVRNAAILDSVEALIGPDILVFHTTVWFKEAGSPKSVPWHQDATYFGLDPLGAKSNLLEIRTRADWAALWTRP